MKLDAVTMDRTEARARFIEYRRAVRAGGNAEDAQIMRGYREIAKGNQVISLTAALRTGGRHENGLPKLAVARADTERCYLASCTMQGAVRYVTKRLSWRVDWRQGEQYRSSTNRRDVRDFPADTLRPLTVAELSDSRGELLKYQEQERLYAIVPNVPPALRPTHALGGYDILWEVDEWKVQPEPPGDPALLKHIGGDLYAVVAVWDLTELERLVVAGRART